MARNLLEAAINNAIDEFDNVHRLVATQIKRFFLPSHIVDVINR